MGRLFFSRWPLPLARPPKLVQRNKAKVASGGLAPKNGWNGTAKQPTPSDLGGGRFHKSHSPKTWTATSDR